MHLLEATNAQETNALILRAFDAAADDSERIVEIRDMQYYLNNELVDTVSADVIEFFDDFGYDIDAGNITPEMLEISGVKIPNLDLDTVKRIFSKENICFTDKGYVHNDPQISCLGGKHGENERRCIVYLQNTSGGRL